MFLVIVRWLHIAAGATALTAMWIPMLTKKGGRAHVRAGWVYVGAMGFVAATAVTMGVGRLLDPATSAGKKAFSGFLLFIAALAASSVWFGVRVLRDKKRRTGAHTNPLDLGWALLLLLGGLAASAIGVAAGSPLLTWFPVIGILLGARQLYHWVRPPTETRAWWLAHMTGMFAACISTVTAFAVFGAPRILAVEVASPLVWLAPTAVLVPVLLVWQRYYRRKFAAGG